MHLETAFPEAYETDDEIEQMMKECEQDPFMKALRQIERSTVWARAQLMKGTESLDRIIQNDDNSVWHGDVQGDHAYILLRNVELAARDRALAALDELLKETLATIQGYWFAYETSKVY